MSVYYVDRCNVRVYEALAVRCVYDENERRKNEKIKIHPSQSC